MNKEDDRYDDEEGARPSSLRPVHKLAAPDLLYDRQLLRDVEIINARTRAELGAPRPGGTTVQSKRKPGTASHQAGASTRTTPDEPQENEAMKLQSAAMAAALTLVSAGSAMAHERPLFPDAPKTIAQACGAQKDSRAAGEDGSKDSKSKAEPRLNPEYKKIHTFSAFRKKIIEDGWVPVPNPECHDAVMGGYYDEYCSAEPEAMSCRLCKLVPELFRHTSDGYNLMRYTKDGVPLGVTVYGDTQDLDAPGRYGLEVVGWEYTEGLNVILIED